MKRYKVETISENTEKYFLIRDYDTMDIVLLPTKYLKHKIMSNRSPNTVRRSAFAADYYNDVRKQKKSTVTVDDLGKISQIDDLWDYFEINLSDIKRDAFYILSCLDTWKEEWFQKVRERFDIYLLSSLHVLRRLVFQLIQMYMKSFVLIWPLPMRMKVLPLKPACAGTLQRHLKKPRRSIIPRGQIDLTNVKIITGKQFRESLCGL